MKINYTKQDQKKKWGRGKPKLPKVLCESFVMETFKAQLKGI